MSFWENFRKYHPFSWRDWLFAAHSLKVPLVTSTLPFRLSGKSPGWRLALLVLDLPFALGDTQQSQGRDEDGEGGNVLICIISIKLPYWEQDIQTVGPPPAFGFCLWVLSFWCLQEAEREVDVSVLDKGRTHSSSCLGYEASVAGLALGIPHSHPHANLHLPSSFLCDASFPDPRRLLHGSS